MFDTLISVTHTMMTLAEVPEAFWEAAVLHAEFVHNIYPDDGARRPSAASAAQRRCAV